MATLTVVLVGAAFFLIGAAIGHLYSRKTQGGVSSTRDLEKQLEISEKKLQRYQQEVTEHFVTVSHLTTSAIRLASPEVGRQLLKAGGSDLSMLDADGNPLINAEDIQPPRDYAPKVPGGILSEEYGLDDNDLSKDHPDAANGPGDVEDDENSDPTLNVS